MNRKELIKSLLDIQWDCVEAEELNQILKFLFETPKEFLEQEHRTRQRIIKKVLKHTDIIPKHHQETFSEFLGMLVLFEARVNFYSFVKLIAPIIIPNEFKDGRHIQIICEELQELYESYVDEARRTGRLQVFLPPRSMKSVLCSILFPAWILGRNPKYRVLLIGGSRDIAIDVFGRPLKNLMKSQEYLAVFPETSIDPDVQSAQRFNTKQGGGFYCSGGSQGIAGRGGDFIICDDVINEQTAWSKVERTKVNNNYVPGIRSRAQPGAAELIVNCVTGDTLVEMGDGTQKQIKEINLGETVTSINTKTKEREPKKVIGVFDNGLDTVYEIKTKNGESFKCNENHPLFVPEKNEYVKVKDLKIGNKLLLMGKKDSGVDPEDLKPTEAYLTGFMLGDGWTINTKRKSGSLRYVTCWAYGEYEELNLKILDLFKTLYDVDMKKTKFGYYRTDKKIVCERLRNLGVVGKAKTKRIPEWVFKSSLKTRQEFFDGFMDADGHTGKDGHRTIGLCNYELVKDLKYLCQSLGYSVGKIHKIEYTVQPPNSPKPIDAVQYRIQIGKIQRDFFETPITSIEVLENKEKVYDLTVEDNHNFLVNQMVSSNTRWNLDDLSGFTQKMDGYTKEDGKASKPYAYRPWKIIRVPAILNQEGSQVLRKKGDPASAYAVGTSYWPEWKTLEELEALRQNYRATEPFKWEALYMQNPVPEEGNIIKYSDFKIWKSQTPPKVTSVVVALDMAFSEKQRADFTAYSVWGIFYRNIETISGSQSVPNIILLYSEKGKWNFHELCDKLEWLRSESKWKPDYYIVEKAAGNITIIRELYRRQFPVYEFDPKGKKEERVQAASMIIKADRVWVPLANPDIPDDTDLKPWAQELIDEASNFPSVPHDDLTDTLAMAIIWLRDNGTIHYEAYEYKDEDEDSSKEDTQSFSYWSAAANKAGW